ncbi:MAG: RNA polymerase sigma factor [Lachnospiraceae bacterium]|nr:RNA polymerase sigma factor [Lachnospiraceae bacterium]
MEQHEFEQCVEQMRLGNQDGLKKVYENYLGYIYTIIFGILGNKENAEDVTADFFIRLWNSASSYQKGNSHRAWLATIARNMALDFLRKHRREIPMEEDIQEADASQNVEKTVVGEVTVMEALKHLKENERCIVDMKVLGEMTFQEISEVLSIPLGTVTWRYQNAMKKLRRYGYE